MRVCDKITAGQRFVLPVGEIDRAQFRVMHLGAPIELVVYVTEAKSSPTHGERVTFRKSGVNLVGRLRRFFVKNTDLTTL